MTPERIAELRTVSEVLRESWDNYKPITLEQLNELSSRIADLFDELLDDAELNRTALEVCGEKIDSYIDKSMEDEKKIEKLEAEVTTLKKRTP
jgi:polyhydroxyalkanoate synthesis regulator phasin